MNSLALALIFITLGEIKNNADPSGWLSPLLQIPIGVVLAWFMLRAEKKMEDQNKAQRAVAVAIERNTQGAMLVLISLRNLDASVTDLAKTLESQSKEAIHGHENPPD